MRAPVPIIAATLCATLFAVGCRSASSEVAEANRRYEKAAYDRALASYERSLARVRPTTPNAVRLRYNIGTTYYQLNQTGTATAELLQTAERTPLLRGKRHEPFRALVYYNLGNSFFREGDFGRAVDAYIEVLKLDPSDKDAKHNLELALDRLRQQASSGGPPQPDTPADGRTVPRSQGSRSASPGQAKTPTCTSCRRPGRWHVSHRDARRGRSACPHRGNA